MPVSALDVRSEFLNANASKAYPLDQSTGGAVGTVPGGLFTDAYLLVDGIADIYSTVFYISQLEVTATGFLLSLACEYDNNIYNFNRVLYCAFNNDSNSDIRFFSSDQGVSVSGAFTVGNPLLVKDYPPSTIYDAANGRLSPLIIKDVNGLFVTGIVLGGETLTGDVVLNAGDGIEFLVTGNTNSAGNITGGTITVTNTRYLLNGGTIHTDSELVSEAIELFGNPVRTVCGVAPDTEGNIAIAVPTTEDTSKYYIKVDQSNATAGTLQLAINRNPCLENTVVENLMTNLEQLNIRASRLDDGVKALDNAINAISIQLTRL